VFVLIAFIGGVIISSGAFVMAGKAVYELFVPKPDALSVARDDARDKLDFGQF
jgi:hypothetical protein